MQVELSNEELRKLSTELARVASTPLIHVRSMYGSGLDKKPQRLPILENLYMQGDGKSLKFFAQSGDKSFNVGLCYTLPRGDVQGDTVIPANKFAKLVAAGKPTDKVTVEVKDTLFENAAYTKEADFVVSVESAPLKAKLAANPWWDYPNGSLFDRVLREGFEGNPNISEWEKPDNRMSLTEKELKAILKGMKFAMSSENERVSLRGICFDFALNRYSACAMAVADGSRVVVKFFGSSMPSVEGEVEIVPEKYIVPVEAVELLYRLLGSNDNPVVLRFSGKVAEFTLSCGVRIVTQLVDGSFPDYFMVLPDKASRPERFICEKDELIAKVRAVMPFANKKYKGVQLLLGEKELVIRARNPEGDTVDSTVSEKHIHSRPAGGFCMGFNGGYLLEMLDAVGTEQVELSSSSSESICLITPQDEDSWHYMLAPMRL